MNGRNEPCRLCHSEGEELRFSHILPEFLYKPLRDEKHRYIAFMHKQETGAKRVLLQKGIREYLLCGDCEQVLAKYERYAANVLRKLPDTARQLPGVVPVKGVDYTKFKIFQLSLLWRAGVSRQASFQEVNLGPHEEVLRSMILKGDPGKPIEYGCVLMRTEDPKAFSHIIRTPRHLRFSEHHAYGLLLFGMIWIFIVSSHSDQIYEKNSFLTEAGVLPIHVITKASGDQYIAALAEEARSMGFV
jgi:hypothetical protein